MIGNEVVTTIWGLVGLAVILIPYGLQDVAVFKSGSVKATITTLGSAAFSYAIYLTGVGKVVQVVLFIFFGVLVLLAWYTNHPIPKAWRITKGQLMAFNKAMFAVGAIVTLMFILIDSKPPLAPVAFYRVILSAWIFLALLVFWARSREMAFGGQDRHTTSHRETEVPAHLVPQLRHPKNDAIEQLEFCGRDYSSLTIMRGEPGWPVHYPIRIHNIRPIPVEIIGYTVTISFNDVPVQPVKWSKPDTTASNGAAPGNTSLSPDHSTVLHIPVSLAQMSVLSLPLDSPSWSAMCELHFQGDDREVVRRVDLRNDRYVLTSQDWEALRSNAFPK